MKRLFLMTGIALAVLMIVSIFTSVAVFSQEKTHTDSTNGFTIKYPEGWTVGTTDPNYKAIFFTQDGSAFIGVAVHKVGKGVKAKTFHLKFEETMQAKMAMNNKLPEAKRNATAGQLSMANADDGYVGQYEVVHSGQRLNMDVITMIKGEYVYVVFGIYNMDAYKTPNVLRAMENSFRITK